MQIQRRKKAAYVPRGVRKVGGQREAWQAGIQLCGQGDKQIRVRVEQLLVRREHAPTVERVGPKLPELTMWPYSGMGERLRSVG